MKKIILCSLFLLSIIGCKKDLLDLSPKDKITDAEFWQSTNDLKLYVNGFYNRVLPSFTGFGTLGYYSVDADQGTDNMVLASGYNTNMNGERVVPASGGGWATADWAELRNINYFLANYKKVTGAPSAINPYVGEALFFRAWFYYDKLQNFGDLPWFNKPVQSTDTELIYGARLKRNVVADSILADLDKAISLLPSKSAAEQMRINRETAMAFQSRIALYEGTWEKYHAGTDFGVAGSDGRKYLEKAAAVSEALINSNVLQLDNNGLKFGYWSVFNQTDYTASKEVMLWRKYSVTESPTFGTNWNRSLALGGGVGLTKALVDDYLCADGKPIAGNPLYKGDDLLVNVVANRDPRLAQTICVPDPDHVMLASQNIRYFTLPGFSSPIGDRSATGYQLYKSFTPDPAQQSDLFNTATVGLIYFRYGEVLLNFAEAKAELGTLNQGDIDKSIKKLRDRVGMPNLTIGNIVNDPNWIFPGLSPVINEVRRERRIELASEGFRKADIFRWAAADKLIVGLKPRGAKKSQWTASFPASVLNGYPEDANGYIEMFKNVPAMASGYKFRPNRDYLLPIPTNEFVLNPQLKQNPNW